MKQGIRCFLGAVALGALALGTAAQGEERLVVPVADPSRPVTLEIRLLQGDISVSAYDGKDVVVVTDAPVRDTKEDEKPREDGLRRIQSSSVGLTADQKDNTVSLRMDFSPRNVDVEVQVPRQTSVHANLTNGGDVVVTGVTGTHELSNVNGDVIARDIAGSAVMNSTNGDVTATFRQVDATKPMSFTSFNGDVDTDFDVVAQDSPATVERGPGVVRMRREMRYSIGGGGPPIQFRTFNGDIMIRKR
jgi:hypothetical protein